MYMTIWKHVGKYVLAIKTVAVPLSASHLIAEGGCHVVVRKTSPGARPHSLALLHSHDCRDQKDRRLLFGVGI